PCDQVTESYGLPGAGRMDHQGATYAFPVGGGDGLDSAGLVRPETQHQPSFPRALAWHFGQVWVAPRKPQVVFQPNPLALAFGSERNGADSRSEHPLWSHVISCRVENIVRSSFLSIVTDYNSVPQMD